MSKKREKYYPKTRRFKEDDERYVITEKLDGSNLGLGKLDGNLIIFQRSKAYKYVEGLAKDIKGLEGWLQENLTTLLRVLQENQVIFGEWLGMGKLKYPMLHKYYIFACGQILKKEDGDYSVYNLTNNSKAINKHCYNILNVASDLDMSMCIEVCKNQNITLKYLDDLYEHYCNNVERDVEGFVIYDTLTDMVEKYVRYKNGKKSLHTWTK